MIFQFLSIVAYIGLGLFAVLGIAFLISLFIPDDPPCKPVRMEHSSIDDDGTRVLVMQMDSTDWSDIQRAITQRQLRRSWQAYEAEMGMSNVCGMAVAEICREWMRQQIKA